MKKKIFIIIFLSIILISGCATMRQLGEDIKNINKEGGATTEIELINNTVGTMIPEPYRIPASIGIGYLICLIRRIYKRKKGSNG